MARVLEAQNPGNALVARFAQPGTVAVITGQQVGLFSGPAYTIYKALTAARLAADLNASGIPAVPIFWMATEDHDFAEVDHAWIFDAGHHPVMLRTEAPPAWLGKQRPAGGCPVEHPPIAELRKALAGFAHRRRSRCGGRAGLSARSDDGRGIPRAAGQAAGPDRNADGGSSGSATAEYRARRSWRRRWLPRPI